MGARARPGDSSTERPTARSSYSGPLAASFNGSPRIFRAELMPGVGAVEIKDGQMTIFEFNLSPLTGPTRERQPPESCFALAYRQFLPSASGCHWLLQAFSLHALHNVQLTTAPAKGDHPSGRPTQIDRRPLFDLLSPLQVSSRQRQVCPTLLMLDLARCWALTNVVRSKMGNSSKDIGPRLSPETPPDRSDQSLQSCLALRRRGL